MKIGMPKITVGTPDISLPNGGPKISMPKMNLKLGYDSRTPLNIGSGDNSWNSMWQNIDTHSDKLGRFLQSSWDSITGKNARLAQERAAAEMERARRDSIVKQYGATQQAENMAYANSMRSTGGARSDAPGMVGQQGGEGTIGANISMSGTF